MSIYIGIDPGKSGGMAALNETGQHLDTIKLSETERDIANWLGGFATQHSMIRATLERVSAMPGQGVSSTFKFGVSYGFLQGLLTAYAVPFEFVSPAKWQRSMQCLSGGDKNVTKAAAQRLFPHLKIIHANADALLIAEYCRRQCIERGQ